MSSPVITAFRDSPDQGRGLARDMRVRWALEEAGIRYDVRLLSFASLKEPGHLLLNPFGQIPTFQHGHIELFESGAIVLHIAGEGRGLLPDEPRARARSIMWMFAALNTVEPPILELETARLLEADQPWTAERIPLIASRVEARLRQLAQWLGDAEWLEGSFGVGDLMMASVLMRIQSSGLLQEYPSLSEFVARCQSRPAYRRAFAGQLAVFAGTRRGGS